MVFPVNCAVLCVLLCYQPMQRICIKCEPQQNSVMRIAHSESLSSYGEPSDSFHKPVLTIFTSLFDKALHSNLLCKQRAKNWPKGSVQEEMRHSDLELISGDERTS